MAINLATRYPGRANPADTNYPQGSFKNRSAPGVLDGSYLEKDWANDFFAFFQQSLVEAGISPNDTVDNATNSQYYQALKSVFAEKNDFLSIATTAFEASVTDGEAVYWDSANSRFDEAIADGTNKQNMIGFADVTNGRVILMGAYLGQLIGLTAGAKYYLSGTVAGAITETAPTNNGVLVGVAKSATELFVDVDASGTVPQATETTPGIAEIATQSETNSGVDDTRFVTPLKLQTKFNITGNAPVYPCRAWVNFNGTGTVAIRASGNVSSVTDNGTGSYTINFINAMPDTNYATSVTNGASQSSGSGPFTAYVNTDTAQTASLVRISTTNFNTAFDGSVVSVSVFR